MSDNKCMTCAMKDAWSTAEGASVCSVCVGFKNWVAIAPGALPASLPVRVVRNYNVTKALAFLDIAQSYARRSKDRSTKVGVLMLDSNFNIRSAAWNGFARGINDTVAERHERPAKYLWTCHAEENAVAQAARVGVSLDGCTALVTALFPCTTCSRMMIQAGIVRILAPGVPANTRWDGQEVVALEMLAEAGIEIIRY